MILEGYHHSRALPCQYVYSGHQDELLVTVITAST